MKKRKKPFPLHPATVVLLFLGILGGAVHACCSLSVGFADLINGTAGAALRFLLCKLTDPLPFSLAELLLFSSPVLIFLFVLFAIRQAKKGRVFLCRALCGLLGIGAFVYFCFGVGFAPAYRATPIEKKLSLERRDISKDELYEATLLVSTRLEGLCADISFDGDGASVMPYGHAELCRLLCLSQEELYRERGVGAAFSSRVKPLIVSPLMTYTHISGIYTFFTGEANLNTNYPDYVNVYTAAHEMTHQRGIAREDEANFAAFLICEGSDDAYINYCAYLNMFEYLSSALYSKDPDLYLKAYDSLPTPAKGELEAFSLFFEKYSESTVSEVSDSLNDAYLVAQGTEGTESYGMVVDLAVIYLLTDKAATGGIN